MSNLKPYFEVRGQGPNLVLLHGWGLHSGIWELLTVQLESNFTLHLIDLPGFGRSPIPNADYDLDLIIEQVLKVVPKKAYYLGWSLGGLVATQMALDYPERVTKLITAATNAKFVEDDNWPYAMKSKVMDSFCQYLEDDYQGTIIRFLAIQAIGSETQKKDIKLLKDSVFVHGVPAKKALREGLAMLDKIDQREGLSQIRIPFLRLYGRLDSLVPSKVADEISLLAPHSVYKIYPKASHAPFLSHKEIFIEDIKAFLLEKDTPFNNKEVA